MRCGPIRTAASGCATRATLPITSGAADGGPRGVLCRAAEHRAETRVDLEQPVPVHLDYRTAFTEVTGGLQFRRDIYGRDRDIWNALEAQGWLSPEIGGRAGAASARPNERR